MQKKLVVKQDDIKDCGAACLLSIIKYYDGYISLEKIKVDACLSKSGISAFNLLSAAKSYGFDTQGVKLSFEELIKNDIVLPVIAYLELENGLRHYVVIYKIEKKYILIMDPASGYKKMSDEDFEKVYKDVILKLYPIANIVNYKEDNKLFKMFSKIFIEEKKLIINLFISSLIISIMSIILSFYTKSIVNNLSNSSMFIYLLFGIFFSITILKVLISYLRDYYEVYLNKNIDLKILPNFLEHIFKLPLNAIVNKTVGEITKRVSELNNIKELFSNMFITLVLNLLLAVTSWLVLFYINDKLTFVLVIVIIIYLLNNILWLKPINNYIEDNLNLETEYMSTLTNNLNHFISIKNNNNYSTLILQRKLENFISNSFKLQLRISIYNFINNFILEIGIFILNTIGFILIMSNNLQLLDLITYDALYLYFISPIKEIINLIPKYIFIRRSFMKINNFIMLDEEEKEIKLESFQNGDILFSKVTFSYNRLDYPIKDYDLKIKSGNKVLVMGKSGSGKSTLFKLLVRLYNVSKGSIKIGNINILDYSINTIRNNISYVSQDDAIFNDTILNNITLGQDIDSTRLNKIIKLCNIDDILDKKALRLNTFISSENNNLSGGEKARIIIARTLIKNSSIIIFDETFSSISEDDANTMIENIFKSFIDKTFIIVSHFKPKYIFDQEIVGGFNE